MLRRLRDRLGHWLLGLQPHEVTTVRQLAADFAQIRLEWAETLDFVSHWAGRQAKRDARVLKSLAKEPDEPGPQLANGTDRESAKSHLRQLAATRRAAGNP